MSQQAPGGHWSLSEGEVASLDSHRLSRHGVTALSMLTLLGDGSTLRYGKDKNALKKALRWLREQIHPKTGSLGEDATALDRMLVGLAMTETYGLSHYKLIRRSAQLTVDSATALKRPEGPVIDAFLAELVAAAWAFDLNVGDPGEQGEAAAMRHDGHPGVAVAAKAVAAGFRGPSSAPGQNQRVVDLLVLRAREANADVFTFRTMEWFFGAHVLRQVGGDDWDVWSQHMFTALPAAQVTEGDDLAGSWAPQEGETNTSRIVSTALYCLSLQAAYRYQPLLSDRPR